MKERESHQKKSVVIYSGMRLNQDKLKKQLNCNKDVSLSKKYGLPSVPESLKTMRSTFALLGLSHHPSSNGLKASLGSSLASLSSLSYFKACDFWQNGKQEWQLPYLLLSTYDRAKNIDPTLR